MERKFIEFSGKIINFDLIGEIRVWHPDIPELSSPWWISIERLDKEAGGSETFETCADAKERFLEIKEQLCV